MAGQTNDDPAWLLVAILAILGGLGWVVWYHYEEQFLEVFRYLRFAEMSVLSFFSQEASACASWLWHAKVGTGMPTQLVVQHAVGCFGPDLLKAPPQQALQFYNITSDSISYVGHYIGSYMRWFVAALCVYFVYAAAVSKRNAFKTRHNLESFIKTQVKMWPVISPIVNFNPSKHSARILGGPVPDKLPLFAEALSPEEWLSFHRIPVVNGVPDREATRRAFISQLGPRWTGFGDLPPYIQGLAAAFALKGVQKREESDEFLGRLSLCWSAEKGYNLTSELMADIKAILKDPEVGGKALEIAGKHAYRTTALLGLLQWARFMGGVLAAAQFLWLRGVDRELWYALNNQGRRSFHTEGAGAIAHFMAESSAKKALPIPRMDTAIVTLNIYMGGDVPITVPPREEPSKARG